LIDDSPMIKNNKGFTIIEIIMAIVVVGILAGASSMYIMETVNLWRFLSFRNESVSQGRAAMVRMAREIRGLASVTTAGPNELQFDDLTGATINYQLSGSNLLRNALVLANDVQNLQFCYYNSNSGPVCSPLCSCGVDSADLDDIKRISMELTVQSGTQTKTLRTQIWPRNQ